jgi:hypothetical protein
LSQHHLHVNLIHFAKVQHLGRGGKKNFHIVLPHKPRACPNCACGVTPTWFICGHSWEHNFYPALFLILSYNIFVSWQLSICNCCQPFFPLLYNCQLLCFWRLALSIVVPLTDDSILFYFILFYFILFYFILFILFYIFYVFCFKIFYFILYILCILFLNLEVNPEY